MTRTETTCSVRPTGARLHFAAALAALLLLLPLWPAQSAETNQTPAPVVFHVGMSKVCFLDVNRNDATAAYKVFLENQGRRIGKIYKADPQVFDDMPSFEAAIQQQPMHMAVMDAWQFLTMDIHQQMKPFFAVMANGKVGRRYLVLTRRDRGFRTLRSLRGKSLLQISAASASVGKTWLDTLLLSEGLGTQETFFGSVEVVSKPTAAVLPVFFGKQPACVVDEPTFAVMKELNPQVGEMLQVLAVSETFADVVICLRDKGWLSEKDKSDTVQSLRELHLDPVGQQICTLFRIDRMVSFQETQLDTVRKLRATCDQIQKGSQPSAETTPLSGSGDTTGRRPQTARNTGETTSDLPLPRAEPARQTTQ